MLLTLKRIQPLNSSRVSMASTQESKRRKKTTALPQLTPEQEEMLVEWYRDHNLFYDHSVKDFKNKGKKDRLLEGKARQLGMTGRELVTWFSNMRTMFGKLKKNNSGEGTTQYTARQLWILQAFDFLAHHLVLKTDRRQFGRFPPSSKSTPATAKDEDKEQNNEDGDPVLQRQQCLQSGGDQEHPSSSVSTSTPVGSSQGPQKRLDERITRIQKRMSGKQRLEQRLEETVSNSNNPRTLWAHWLASELSVMSEANWMQFQQRSFQWIMSVKKQQASDRSLLPSRESQHNHSGPFQHPPPQPQWPEPQEQRSSSSNSSSSNNNNMS